MIAIDLLAAVVCMMLLFWTFRLETDFMLGLWVERAANSWTYDGHSDDVPYFADNISLQ